MEKLADQPGRKALENADMDFIVATKHDITMVEGEANECQEEDLIEAMKLAHETIKVQIAAQEKLAEMVGDKALIKRDPPEIPENEALKARVESLISNDIYELARSAPTKKPAKNVSRPTRSSHDSSSGRCLERKPLGSGNHWPPGILKRPRRTSSAMLCLVKPSAWTDVKPMRFVISGQLDYLQAHGSSIFTRGEAQSLTSLTLGTKEDQALVDIALDPHDEKFILHYNFPPSTGGKTNTRSRPS
ncbi:MAG: hypothetical protein R2778_10585 [Saprospiraceae bacterium]